MKSTVLAKDDNASYTGHMITVYKCALQQWRHACGKKGWCDQKTAIFQQAAANSNQGDHECSKFEKNLL